MRIREAQAKLKQLERSILQQLAEFETLTGMYVDDIFLTRKTFTGGTSILEDVDIKVGMEGREISEVFCSALLPRKRE